MIRLAIFSAALATAAGCGQQDACLDDGGVWDADAQRCYCSRAQEEINAWREWCSDASGLESIRNKIATVPAPEGA